MAQAQVIDRNAAQRHSTATVSGAAALPISEAPSMSQSSNVLPSPSQPPRKRSAAPRSSQKRPSRSNLSSAKKCRCASPVATSEAPGAGIDVPPIDILAAAASAVGNPVIVDLGAPALTLADLAFFNLFFDLCLVPSLEAHAISSITSSLSPLLNQQFSRLRISIYRNELLQQIFSQPSSASASGVMSAPISALYHSFLLQSQALGLTYL